MTTVYIAYSGNKDTFFDRVYYAEKHLPLVVECWAEHGLEDVAAFYPELDGKGLVAICVCTFTDEVSVSKSLQSERTAEVMADIPRFTDSKPLQQLATPLRAS